MPETFLPASWPFRVAVSVLFTLCACPRSSMRCMRCAPVSCGPPRQADFFKACSSRLIPCSLISFQIWKYACTVCHLGKSLGSARHWQPVRSRYSTAQNTSYSSTVRGFVRLRACSRIGRICSKRSRLMSLGYVLWRMASVCTHQKIVNRLLHRTRKAVLAPGLEHADGHCIGKVQAALTRPHGQA